ncbi:DUF6507 family protein [Streptomyces huiliensis]|uniref:DUF6507 family protein n=1 Tax=Streptomyces huiliensis TaxID=2876027 RepID=UPI001CC152B8|nr:DUF6507 family protein [Streptomyces huiliensis]MBZ4319710.1 DUF6507 family protein [Streptomyces huiliensis]
MSGWDIDVPGVEGALRNTREATSALKDELADYVADIQHAGTSAGTIAAAGTPEKGGNGGAGGSSAGIIAAALGYFAQHTQEELLFVAARAGQSMNGAYQATSEYIKGDLTMAARAQHDALRAPDVKALTAQARKGGGKP